jgi:chromosome partitioning protein
VQAEYYALEGLSQLVAIVRRIKEGLNPELTIRGVLITMFDGRTKLATEVLEEVHRYFPDRVFQTQIPRNIRLSEAPSYGKPAILFDVKSRGAQAYLSLAKELVP